MLSEPTKSSPSLAVIDWLGAHVEDDLFVSVIAIAEIRRGIGKLDDGRRKTMLTCWLEEDLVERFEGRILPVDLSTALGWGAIVVQAGRRGRAIGIMDAFIAATALDKGLALATRNMRDFEELGLDLIDPWSATRAGHSGAESLR